jgi:hypothetical protein
VFSKSLRALKISRKPYVKTSVYSYQVSSNRFLQRLPESKPNTAVTKKLFNIVLIQSTSNKLIFHQIVRYIQKRRVNLHMAYRNTHYSNCRRSGKTRHTCQPANYIVSPVPFHSFIHSTMALQPFVGPWPLFQFHW